MNSWMPFLFTGSQCSTAGRRRSLMSNIATSDSAKVYRPLSNELTAYLREAGINLPEWLSG